MKGKVLLVIALYLILGVIGLFNFGFQEYFYGLYGGTTSPKGSTLKRLSGDIRNLRSVVVQEQEDDSSKDPPEQEERD